MPAREFRPENKQPVSITEALMDPVLPESGSVLEVAMAMVSALRNAGKYAELMEQLSFPPGFGVPQTSAPQSIRV